MLNEVFILKDGLCAFHRSYRDRTIEDVTLIGGFLEAILLFSKQLSESRLESIAMAESKLHFGAKRTFTFVLREHGDTSLSPEEIETIFNQLTTEFHNQFPDAADSWQGEVHYFDDFSITVDEIIQHRPTRQGFPIPFTLLLKPFFIAPITPLISISQENQDYLYLLQYYLKNLSQYLGSKMSRSLLQSPHLIYLPSTHHLAYIFPFNLDLKTPIPTHLLCFMIEEENWITFYQLLPLIGQEANRILPTLTNYLQLLEKNPSSNEIEDQKTRIHEMLANWADLNRYVSGLQVSLVEEFFKAEIRSDTLTEEQTRAQFNHLLTRLGSDIDKVIFALLSQRQIIFVGDDRTDVEQTLSALLSFYPHPSVALWTESPKDQLLVGTSPSNLQYYNTGSSVIVDLRTNQILHGEKNAFCEELMEGIKQMVQMGSMYDARAFFRGKVSSVFGFIISLLEVFTSEKENPRQKFQNILKHYPEPIIELIVQMSKRLNPIMAKKVEKALGMSSFTRF